MFILHFENEHRDELHQIEEQMKQLEGQQNELRSPPRKRLRYGYFSRYSFADFDEEAQDLSQAWQEGGNNHGSIKMLQKLSAKQFSAVLREIQKEFEDADFALYFGEIMPKMQERYATFKRKVHAAYSAGF